MSASPSFIPESHRKFLNNRRIRGMSPGELTELKKRHKRKVRRIAILFLPVVVLVRLLRPILLIRFGYILRHKIGHCPLELEFYLLEREAGIQPRKSLDLFYFDYGTDGQSANLFAEELARRNAHIWTWVEYLSRANDMLPGGAAHRVVIQFRDVQDIADTSALLCKYPQQITLSRKEEALGQEQLRAIGIPEGEKFICFHVRNSEYWRSRKENIGDDSDFRDSDVSNYIDAMRIAAEKGYYVLRIGATAATPLPYVHERVIDYTIAARSEFMDVYVAMKCSLMVSCGSGIDSISYISRRPLLFVNVVTWHALSVKMPQPFKCIFKHFLCDDKEMPLSKFLGVESMQFDTTAKFRAAGISFRENSPDEISAAVAEMLDEIEGHSMVSAADAELQWRASKLIKRAHRYTDWQFSVSHSYLRMNEELL